MLITVQKHPKLIKLLDLPGSCNQLNGCHCPRCPVRDMVLYHGLPTTKHFLIKYNQQANAQTMNPPLFLLELSNGKVHRSHIRKEKGTESRIYHQSIHQ